MTAAEAVGVRRLVAQSYTGWPNARSGAPVKSEHDPLEPSPPAGQRTSLEAIRYLERTVVDAAPLTGLALRYGSLYGPGTSMAQEYAELIRKRKLPIVGGGAGVWSFIHVDDAATATVAAVERGGERRLQRRRRRPRARLRMVAVPRRAPGRKAAEARPGVAGALRDRRGRDLDDDADPRLVEREGEGGARLGAALEELARGLPARVRRFGGRGGQSRERSSNGVLPGLIGEFQPERAPSAVTAVGALSSWEQRKRLRRGG